MERKRNKKLNIRKTAIRLLFIGIIIYSMSVIASQQFSLAKREKEINKVKQMTAEANGETERLEEELELVETDEYKEQKARELLGYVKPDEKIFIDVTK